MANSSGLRFNKKGKCGAMADEVHLGYFSPYDAFTFCNLQHNKWVFPLSFLITLPFQKILKVVGPTFLWSTPEKLILPLLGIEPRPHWLGRQMY